MAYGELNDHVTSYDPEKSSHDPSNGPSMFGPIISTIADSDLFIMRLLQTRSQAVARIADRTASQ